MMEFLDPKWLWMLPAFLVLGGWLIVWSEARARQRLRRVVAVNLIPSLTRSASPTRRLLKASLLLLAGALGILAAARPISGYIESREPAVGLDVMVAVDTSRSMLAEDLRPTRLERVRLAVLDLLGSLEGDRVGLIGFAGSAFLSCPPTADYTTVQQTLESLQPGVIPVPGTNLAAAIREAVGAYPEGAENKILILITDGEDLEAGGISAAAEAAQQGLHIYTVGVGTTEGAPIVVASPDGGTGFLRDASGKVVVSRLDEQTLRRVAEAAGGLYTPLGMAGEGLQEVLAAIRRDFPSAQADFVVERIPQEAFGWFIVPALVLLAVEVLLPARRRTAAAAPTVATLILLSLILPHPSQGQLWGADRLLADGRYAEAATALAEQVKSDPENLRLRYNLGIARYHLGDFKAAGEAFEAVAQASTDRSERQQALYNLGNALYREGEGVVATEPAQAKLLWEQAIEAFEAAAKLDPEDADAQANQKLATERLRVITKGLTLKVDPAEAGRANGSGRYLPGMEAKVSAQTLPGWKFLKWEGPGAKDAQAAETTVLMGEDRELTAMFVKTWHLDVRVNDQARGTAETTGDYAEKAPVPIKAKPAEGFAFKQWQAEGLTVEEPTNPEATVSLTQDATVTAEFVEAFKLTVTPSPALGGQAGRTDYYEKNTEVLIQAVPNAGFSFDGWTGPNLADPTSPHTKIRLDRDLEAVANFHRDWKLIVLPKDLSQGTATGGGNHEAGATVPIKAEPQPGFKFSHWEGDAIANPDLAETTVVATGEEQEVFAVFSSENNDQGESQSEQQQQDPSSSENQQESDSQQDQQNQPQTPQPQPTEPEQSRENESAQATPAQERELTPEEARQLLEQMRSESYILPIAPAEPKPDPNRAGRDY